MNVGGPAVQVSGLMRGFDSLIFDQRLYTGFCSSNEADYLDLVATDVKAVRIKNFGQRITIGGDMRVLFSLIREIRHFKPDVIHTHTAKAGFLGRIASIVSLQPSIRVHTFHGHLLNGYFGSFKRSLVVVAERLLALFTHELLAVGSKVRQDLLDAGIGRPENFRVVNPGLSTGQLENKVQARASFGLSPLKLHCAFIGRVTQIKRPDRFLDVVSEIKRRGVDLEFFIAGDGELLDLCRKRISSENLPVTILGWQSNIEKILSAADIVILTSDNEGTPLSLIQAGMAGLPVVTTNVGSVAEIVLCGKTGIVTGSKTDDLADALEVLFNSSVLRLKMGDEAHKFTTANFGVDRLVRDHEELYKVLLANQAKF
jgi:glycosyltransferase involved in cell wall biosynthesis